MRIYFRTSRYSSVSIGAGTLLLLSPFIVAGYAIVAALYLAGLVTMWLGQLIVRGVEDLARAIEERQRRRQLTGENLR